VFPYLQCYCLWVCKEQICLFQCQARSQLRILYSYILKQDRPCGLVVRVLGYRSGHLASIPGTTWKKSSGSGTGSTQPREYNWGATW
jgi:hypothetical protein